MSNHKTYKVFIIEWLDLPDSLQDEVREKERFQNDCYLEHFSEFQPHEYAKGMSVIEEYWKDQTETNGYNKSLWHFIKDYCLELDEWIIKSKFDLEGVDKILIHISW